MEIHVINENEVEDKKASQGSASSKATKTAARRKASVVAKNTAKPGKKSPAISKSEKEALADLNDKTVKLEKLSSKAEGTLKKVKEVEHDIEELEKAANEVEINLIGLIKEGAGKKAKKPLKSKLKKLAKNIRKINEKRSKLNKKVARQTKNADKLRKAIAKKAVQ